MFTYIGCACTSIHVRAMYLYTCRGNGIIILHSCGTCAQCMYGTCMYVHITVYKCVHVRMYGTCVYVDGTSTNVYMCMHMYDTCVYVHTFMVHVHVYVYVYTSIGHVCTYNVHGMCMVHALYIHGTCTNMYVYACSVHACMCIVHD